MKTIMQIRDDLRQIKYYYSRKANFDKGSKFVGISAIDGLANSYNLIACKAPARLYDLYICLYVDNHTQESLAEYMGVTTDAIHKMNKKLLAFFQKNMAA